MPAKATEAAEAPQDSEIPGGETPQGSETSTSQPDDGTTKDPLEGLSLEEMTMLIEHGHDPDSLKPQGEETEEREEEENEEEEEEPEAESEEEVETEEVDTETEEDEGAPETEKAVEKLPKRFRLRAEDEQKRKFLKLIQEHPEANPIDLARIAGYKGEEARAQADAVKEEPEAKAPTIEDQLKPERDALQALIDQRKKAVEDFEHGKAIELSEQIAEKRADIRDKERNLREQASLQVQYDADFNAAQRKATNRYPDTAVPGTRQFRLVQAEIARLKETNPDFNQDPNFPNVVLDALEKEYPEIFVKKASAKPSAPPAKTGDKAPKADLPPARKLGKGPAGSSTTAKPNTKAELTRMMDNLSPAELTELADKVGTQYSGPLVGMK